MQHPTNHYQLTFIAGLLWLVASSCAVRSEGRIWSENGQLWTAEGPHFIQAVCYHPVTIGEESRSFANLTTDLTLMQLMGANAIRVYEPIASTAVLDEIHQAGLGVIVGFGYDQGGVYDLKSGSYMDYIETFKSHPAILFWELGNEYNFHPEWFGGSLDVWYETLQTAACAIHAADPDHLLATAHGEVPEAGLVDALSCIDIWGLNVYRWDESHTALADFDAISDKPVYFSEIGADSYMTAARGKYAAGKNERAQADATRNLLQPIFEDSTRAAGLAVFSFTDGWWKAGQPNQQDVGGWAPGSSGVPYDATANEEHWGLVDIHRNKKEAFWVVKSFFESPAASDHGGNPSTNMNAAPHDQ